MRRFLKWAGIGLASLLGLVLVAGVGLYTKGARRLQRHYDVRVEPVAIPTDSASLARGEHLAHAVTLCAACHREDLSGGLIFEAPHIASIYAPNLTAGRGGLGATLADPDYVRAIRHGVSPTGRGLMVMHADAFHNLGARDLGDIIAYVKSVPPVDNEVPPLQTAPLGRVMIALGLFDNATMPLLPVEVINHDQPFTEPPAEGVTREYGGYLVSIAGCRLCHGPNLTGAPPIQEGNPPGPNIAAHAAPGAWTRDQFVTTIRTGVRPDGYKLNTDVMPIEIFHNMTDEELGAIWAFLGSFSAR